ncbi:AAA family ATPase [Polyangium jinanense]|nr:AAA family ATPase [Polyangium jinanense]
MPREKAQNDEAHDEEPKDTSFRDILWFRAKPETRAGRLVAEYVLAVAISTLPLAIVIVTLGRPRDITIVLAALLLSLGLGAVSHSVALIAPILCALTCLFRLSIVQGSLDTLIRSFPPYRRLGLALCIAVAILNLTAVTVAKIWRHRWLKCGWVLLILGITAGLSAGFWLTSGDRGGATLSGMGMGLFAFVMFKELSKSEDTTDLLVFNAALVALGTGLGLSGEIEYRIGSDIIEISIFFVMLTSSMGAIGFLVKGLVRALKGNLPLTVPGSALAGVACGILYPVATGFVAGLVHAPLSCLTIAGLLFGHSLAPTRAGVRIFVELWDIIKTAWSDGWMELRLVPMAILDFEPTRSLVVGMSWVAVLSFPRGVWALLPVSAMLVGYFRLLPEYLFLVMKALWRVRRAQRTSRDELSRYLSDLPPYEHELIVIPIVGHARLLVASFRIAPQATLETVSKAVQMGPSWGYWRTLESAWDEIAAIAAEFDGAERSRLVRTRLLAFCEPERIAEIATHDLSLATLTNHLYNPSEASGDDTESPEGERGDLAELMPALKGVAQGVADALAQDLPIQRERGLERCINVLDRLQGRTQQLGLGDRAAAEWLRVLKHWQVVLRERIETDASVIPHKEVIQPFQSGNPLRADRPYLFKGRKRLAQDIVRTIRTGGRPTLVLHGPRRCGKSSFLLNLSRLLPDDVLPIYVDLQSQAMTSSEGDFCYGLVRAAIRDLRSRGLDPPMADRSTFKSAPYPALEDWLDELRPRLGERRLLLCLDEFEKLGDAMERGRVTTSLFDELRHLAQHRDEFDLIFCGAQTLEELGPGWTSYFINARPIEILYLEPDEARELLLDPDPAFNLKYDEGVVRRVLEMTACQPYLLQLIGEAMVKTANRHGMRHIDEAYLEEALGEALAAGAIYFANLWEETTGATPSEVAAGQRLLLALAHERPLPAMDAAASAALRRLKRYHVVTTGDKYRIEIPLVARWLRDWKGDEARVGT